jgi:hypothetical protein
VTRWDAAAARLDAPVPDYAAPGRGVARSATDGTRAAARTGGARSGAGRRRDRGGSFPGAGAEVERTLRAAVVRLGGGTLQDVGEYTLGLARGPRDWLSVPSSLWPMPT